MEMALQVTGQSSIAPLESIYHGGTAKSRPVALAYAVEYQWEQIHAQSTAIIYKVSVEHSQRFVLT